MSLHVALIIILIPFWDARAAEAPAAPQTKKNTLFARSPHQIYLSGCLHNVFVCCVSILYKWPSHAVSRVCVLCAHNNNKTSARKIRPNVDMSMCVCLITYTVCIVLICFIYDFIIIIYLCIYFVIILFYKAHHHRTCDNDDERSGEPAWRFYRARRVGNLFYI